MALVSSLNILSGKIKECLAKGDPIQVSGLSESYVQLLLSDILTQKLPSKKVIIVLPTNKDFSAWQDFLEQFPSAGSLELKGRATEAAKNEKLKLEIAVLPFFALWGNDRFVNPQAVIHQRLHAASILAGRDESKVSVVLTTFAGLSQSFLHPKKWSELSFTLRTNDVFTISELETRLRDLGYREVNTVTEEGGFAMRGGIVDVFSPAHLHPVRMEFDDEVLASMRFFGAHDQRSLAPATNISICPATEAPVPLPERKAAAQKIYESLIESEADPHDRDGMIAAFTEFGTFSGVGMFYPLLRNEEASFWDYLDHDSYLIFPKAREQCLAKYENLQKVLAESIERDQIQKRPNLPLNKHFLSSVEAESKINACGSIAEFGVLFSKPGSEFIRYESSAAFPFAPGVATFGAQSFEKWMSAIEHAKEKDDLNVVFLARSDEQLERVENLLSHRDWQFRSVKETFSSNFLNSTDNQKISVARGFVSSYIWLQDIRTLIVPDHVLFGVEKKRTKSTSAKLQNLLNSFRDVKSGDLVVHVQHGIGRYMGIVTLQVAGMQSDFLHIEYAGNDKIYLPVDRLSMLQRYSVGGDFVGSDATLDRLRGPDWEKRKAKVQKAIQEMADQLLKLQAERKLAEAPACSALGESYFKFEADFPHQETEDQLRAIQEMNADLSRLIPMDRLVCGDVGFGKTEVALRGSLRVVFEGYQVMVLVPTTILCHQHYRTFHSRLSGLGIRVGHVNRFVSAKEAKNTLEEFSAGKIDVLIGTHRLLSKDVKPKHLGLLVVDEEQRFGVGHKEKLKEIRAGCHVLTLTATPIPRTLHMAIVGLRDISIIATPPSTRVSVKTYVSKFEESLIRDAILTEVSRGGQVFFVHNRVEDIAEMRNFIKSLVPSVEVRFAHGQMAEHQLEEVIIDFIEQKFPVLVCTTIIESGIDMPNVNTIIVNRADRFGLAQLYQLRGRVGRAAQQAFAYLLTPPIEQLSDDAQKRLEVLSSHQELGAGFQIASYDLEIRGAGNLLGGQQSGHVSAIGLDLYTEMLESTILSMRGEIVKPKVDTEIKLQVAALIPSTFIADEGQRLGIYKSLFSAESAEELQALHRDVKDRYGAMPAEFERLFKVAELKRLLKSAGALSLAPSATNGFFDIRFANLLPSQAEHLFHMAQKHPDRYRIAPDQKLMIRASSSKYLSIVDQDRMLSDLIAFSEPLVWAGVR